MKQPIEKIISGCKMMGFEVVDGKAYWLFASEGCYVLDKRYFFLCIKENGLYFLNSDDTKFAKKLINKVSPRVKVEDGEITLSFDEVTFKLTKGSDTTFVADGKRIPLEKNDIIKIKHAGEMVSKDPNRFFLQGVYLTKNDIVGCNMRELYIARCSSYIEEPLWVNFRTLPFLNETECEVMKIEDYVVFDYSQYRLFSIHPTLQYPNYPHVIPNNHLDEDYYECTFSKVSNDFKKWFFLNNVEEDETLIVDNIDHPDDAKRLHGDFPLGKVNQTIGLSGLNLIPLNKILKNGDKFLLHNSIIRETPHGKIPGPISIKTNLDELLILMPLTWGYDYHY